MTQMQSIRDVYQALYELHYALSNHVHLFSAETREQWAQFEQDLKLLESDVKLVASQTTQNAFRTAKLSGAIVPQLESALDRIQESIETYWQGKQNVPKNT